ncbi:MAG TPA: hypothetical protein VH951_01995 [Dehalococcoidia bacterium]
MLGLGTLGYAAASISRQERFAEMTGMEESTIRELAMRDLASGIQILTARNPTPALMSRILYDVTDALRLLRRRPRLAPVAVAWALLAGLVMLTRSSAAASASDAEPAPAAAR